MNSSSIELHDEKDYLHISNTTLSPFDMQVKIIVVSPPMD